MTEAQLEQKLLAAHKSNDLDALMALYTEAANRREADADPDAACFFLTQAFVYALESGSDTADTLQLRLWEIGREEKPHSFPAPVDASR